MTHSLFLAPIAVLVSVSGPIAVHAASTAAEVPAQDFKEFGAYAPLVRSLAGEPDRAKELDFVKACRSRLLREVDRTEPTESLLKRFAAEFEADKVHPVTRIVVATLVANMHGALSKEHGDLGSSLLRRFKDKVSEEQFAFLMCARVKIARYRACGEGAENDAPLKKYLGNILVKHLESEWLTTNPGLQAMLFSLYTADPVNPWLVRDDLAANEAFFKGLEALPAERRTCEMRCALGDHYVNLAWLARGTRWASETTPEQFEKFGALLPVAAAHYREALALNPRSTKALRGLMTISMADSEAAGGTTAEWMAKAETVSPGDTETLNRFAASNMLRWCGSAAAILAAYEECRQSGDFESVKPGHSGEILSFLLKDLRGEELVRINRRRALEFIPIANEYIRRFNESGHALVGANGLAFDHRAKALAYLADAGLLSEAGKVLPYTKPGFQPDGIASVDRHRLFEVDFDYLRALASTEADDFNLLEEGYPTSRTLNQSVPPQEEEFARHTSPEWLADYGRRLEAMAAKVKSPEARRCMQSFIAINRSERDFLEYKTVPVLFDGSLWRVSLGAFTFTGDKAVSDQHTWNRPDHYATYAGYFKPPYELTLHIKSSPYSKWPHVGVCVGRMLSGKTGRGFVLESDTGKTYAMPPASPLNKAVFRQSNDGVGPEAVLKIRVFDHGYAVAVNDRPWVNRRDDGFVPYRISLGSLPGYTAFGRYEYSDFTVRRLKPEEISTEEAAWMRDASKPAAGDSAKK